MALAAREKPSPERVQAAWNEVRELMEVNRITWPELGAAIGKSAGTAKNVIQLGSRYPEQYEGISTKLGQEPGWLQAMLEGEGAAEPAESPKPPTVEAKKKTSALRAPKKSVSVSEKSAPVKAKTSSAWNPPAVPDCPLPVGGPLAQENERLRLRVAALEEQMKFLSDMLMGKKSK